MSGSWGKFLPSIVVIGVVLILLDAIVTYNNLKTVVDNEAWVKHSIEVLKQIGMVDTTLTAAESAERGYIITGNNQFINVFRLNEQQLPKEIATLNQQVADNPQQQKNLQNLRRFVNQRTSLLDRGIKIKQQQVSDVTQQFVATSNGGEIMAESEDTITQMELEENRLLAERSHQSGESVVRMYLTIALASLADLVLLALAFYLTNREFKRRSELEEQQNDFISMASHELKTPITSMKVFAHMLRKELFKYKDRSAGRYLKKLDNQIDKQTIFINELLDVSRARTGRLEVKKQPFDLNQVVKSCLNSHQIGLKNHRIIVKGRISQKVLGDPEKIFQVTDNFLSNAVKYSPQVGKIWVEMSEAKKMARVSIRDNGIGIDQKYHRAIFDRFFRVYENQGRTYPGHGLGLYIASQIIKEHGGKVWVESNGLGQGSTFCYTIPLAQG